MRVTVGAALVCKTSPLSYVQNLKISPLTLLTSLDFIFRQYPNPNPILDPKSDPKHKLKTQI